MTFFWGDKNKKLLEAARKGHTKTVQTLLEKGADVNANDMDGWTALIFAIVKGHTDIVQILIDKGANINLTS